MKIGLAGLGRMGAGIAERLRRGGHGRWTVLEAVERGVSADTLAQSLFSRFTSREEDPFSMRVIAALRNEFGGHAVKQQ